MAVAELTALGLQLVVVLLAVGVAVVMMVVASVVPAAGVESED